jgi:hypothetical protein
MDQPTMIGKGSAEATQDGLMTPCLSGRREDFQYVFKAALRAARASRTGAVPRHAASRLAASLAAARRY